jgi:hypothetical protein
MMTTHTMNQKSLTSVRDRMRARRAARAAEAALLHELAEFHTQADLLELSAMLQRHPDEQSDPIRRAVSWNAAA